MYFFFGLSGAFLFYSGNLLWVEKRRKNQNRHQPDVRQTLSTRLMASATVGVCLGSVAGVCLTLVAGKWLHAAANINTTYLAVYYTVFLASLAWAFWRGAARAAVHLLALCALAAAAIPLTSAAAVLMPSLGWWAHASAATIGRRPDGAGGGLAVAVRGAADVAPVPAWPGRQRLGGRIMMDRADIGSDDWWRAVRAAGTPLQRPLGDGQTALTFLWRDPAGGPAQSDCQRVYLDVYSHTPHPSERLDQHGTDSRQRCLDVANEVAKRLVRQLFPHARQQCATAAGTAFGSAALVDRPDGICRHRRPAEFASTAWRRLGRAPVGVAASGGAGAARMERRAAG